MSRQFVPVMRVDVLGQRIISKGSYDHGKGITGTVCKLKGGNKVLFAPDNVLGCFMVRVVETNHFSVLPPNHDFSWKVGTQVTTSDKRNGIIIQLVDSKSSPDSISRVIVQIENSEQSLNCPCSCLVQNRGLGATDGSSEIDQKTRDIIGSYKKITKQLAVMTKRKEPATPVPQPQAKRKKIDEQEDTLPGLVENVFSAMSDWVSSAIRNDDGLQSALGIT